jgi:hypothetical protein
VTVGGFGGASGNGKAVAVTNHGEITTYGDSAYGIYAESVGGGGGIGGDAASGVTGLFSLGGFGGASGNGGDVTVLNYNRAPSNANITTRGSDADAIFAHSVGGGGGSGGSAGGVLALGGFEAAGGDGGAVNVSNSAKLATRQARSNGILAQSVGGGGGKGGSTGLSVIAIGGKGGNGGKGGKVQVTNTGEILTEGADSMGIFAQSIGGSGGITGAGSAGSPVAPGLAGFCWLHSSLSSLAPAFEATSISCGHSAASWRSNATRLGLTWLTTTLSGASAGTSRARAAR